MYAGRVLVMATRDCCAAVASICVGVVALTCSPPRSPPLPLRSYPDLEEQAETLAAALIGLFAALRRRHPAAPAHAQQRTHARMLRQRSNVCPRLPRRRRDYHGSAAVRVATTHTTPACVLGVGWGRGGTAVTSVLFNALAATALPLWIPHPHPRKHHLHSPHHPPDNRRITGRHQADPRDQACCSVDCLRHQQALPAGLGLCGHRYVDANFNSHPATDESPLSDHLASLAEEDDDDSFTIDLSTFLKEYGALWWSSWAVPQD